MKICCHRIYTFFGDFFFMIFSCFCVLLWFWVFFHKKQNPYLKRKTCTFEHKKSRNHRSERKFVNRDDWRRVKYLIKCIDRHETYVDVFSIYFCLGEPLSKQILPPNILAFQFARYEILKMSVSKFSILDPQEYSFFAGHILSMQEPAL